MQMLFLIFFVAYPFLKNETDDALHLMLVSSNLIQASPVLIQSMLVLIFLYLPRHVELFFSILLIQVSRAYRVIAAARA